MFDKTNIFDPALVARHRDRAAVAFDQHNFLVQRAIESMMERLADMRREFPRVLILGARTGQAGMIVHERPDVQSVLQADRSQAMLDIAKGERQVVDSENLPFAPESFDLVLSILDLHWVNDLPGALIQIRRILKPNGLFIGNLFGGETLTELRQVLTQAEIQTAGGASPRISPVTDVKTMGSLLQRAGFEVPVADSDTVSVVYPHMLGLLHDLRGMGETNAMVKRGGMLRPNTFAAAMQLYQNMFNDGEGGVVATFETITITGLAAAGKT